MAGLRRQAAFFERNIDRESSHGSGPGTQQVALNKSGRFGADFPAEGLARELHVTTAIAEICAASRPSEGSGLFAQSLRPNGPVFFCRKEDAVCSVYRCCQRPGGTRAVIESSSLPKELW